MDIVLEATETTGEDFSSSVPFMVFLDTHTDGWFVEYAVHKENKSEMNWKKWHNQPIQEHGELSRVLVYGMRGVRYRLNSGNVGATAVRESVGILQIR